MHGARPTRTGGWRSRPRRFRYQRLSWAYRAFVDRLPWCRLCRRTLRYTRPWWRRLARRDTWLRQAGNQVRTGRDHRPLYRLTCQRTGRLFCLRRSGHGRLGRSGSDYRLRRSRRRPTGVVSTRGLARNHLWTCRLGPVAGARQRLSRSGQRGAGKNLARTRRSRHRTGWNHARARDRRHQGRLRPDRPSRLYPGRGSSEGRAKRSGWSGFGLRLNRRFCDQGRGRSISRCWHRFFLVSDLGLRFLGNRRYWLRLNCHG